MTNPISDLDEVVLALQEQYFDRYVRCSDFIRKHHAAIRRAFEDAEGTRRVSYEIVQNGVCEAGSDDLSDALHYCAMYQQDGPVELHRVVCFSTVLDLATAAMQATAPKLPCSSGPETELNLGADAARGSE
jgi:hypothetical protein